MKHLSALNLCVLCLWFFSHTLATAAPVSPSPETIVPGIGFFPEEVISHAAIGQTLMVYNTGTDVLDYSVSVVYKNELPADNPADLCIENLYSSGCDFGDGLVSWKFANVTIPEIPCAGSPSWYHIYPEYVHQIHPGYNYELIVEAGYANTYFDVWIDWNKDSQLNNDEELLLNDGFCAGAQTPYSFSITIPWWASPGYFIMRARTNWQNPVTDACETYSYGNCNDFVVSCLNIEPVYWLSATPGSGSISPGDSAAVAVEFNAMGLNYGAYYADLVFTSNAPGSPHQVPVALLLSSSSECLSASSQMIVENHIEPPQMTSQTISLQNNCDQPVNFSATITYPDSTAGFISNTKGGFPNADVRNDWLSIEPATGWLLGDQSGEITIFLNSANLSGPATYNATINFFTQYSDVPLEIPVELNLQDCGWPAVSELTCHFSDLTTVELTWAPPLIETLRWDDGANFTGLGGVSDFFVAAKWSPAHLADYAGWWLTHILFYPTSDEATYTLKVWTGEDAGLLLLSQLVGDYVPNQWNSIELEPHVYINAEEWHWLGYQVSDQPYNYPAGSDAGPAVVGFGDLISVDGVTWESIFLTYGMDYNWNIAGILIPPDKVSNEEFTPINYTVYRNDELIASLPPTAIEYTDNQVPFELPEYKVGAVYSECETLSEACIPLPVAWMEVFPESFLIALGQGAIITEELLVINSGHQTSLMDYQIEIQYLTSQEDWLSLLPAFGQISGLSTDTVLMTVNTENLQIGEHKANLVITTNALNQQIVEIPVVLDLITGISFNQQAAIQIYPNPTRGMFIIDGIKSSVKVSVFDTYGVEVFSKEEVLPLQVDLAGRSKGVYFLRIQQEGKIYFKKVITK
jgi:hypothetical protein